MAVDTSHYDDERMAWIMTYLALPESGVKEAFSTVSQCEARFAAIRWPDGPVCPKCSGKDVGFLELRKLYYCRNCAKQFSVTSATRVHRSRVNLKTWFVAAGDIITAHARGEADAWLTGHGMAERYRLSYAAAYRLKQLLLDDLNDPQGLFRTSICVRTVQFPPDVAGSKSRLNEWLVDEMMSRTPSYWA